MPRDVFGPPAMRGSPRGICDDLWPSHSEPYGLTARPVTLLRALRRLVAILLWPLARKQAASGDRMAH